MSVWDNIPKSVMSSDLPDELIAGVTKIGKTMNKRGDNVLQLTLKTVQGVDFIIQYKLPKAWTGKGQADLLKVKIEGLGLKSPEDMVGHVYKWKRMELEGSMKGFARHYPIGEVKGKIN